MMSKGDPEVVSEDPSNLHSPLFFIVTFVLYIGIKKSIFLNRIFFLIFALF